METEKELEIWIGHAIVGFLVDDRWPPTLLVLWSSVGGWSNDGSGIYVGEYVAPSSSGGPWSITFLILSLVALVSKVIGVW